jgi:hypothetical protein
MLRVRADRRVRIDVRSVVLDASAAEGSGERTERSPMAKVRSSKRQLEQARREKAVAKRERRDVRAAEGPGDVVAGDMAQDEVLAALAAVHAQYADGGMSLEDFEAAKEDLVRRLTVD